MKKFFALFCICILIILSGCQKKVIPGIDTEIPGDTVKKEIVFYNLFDPEDSLRGQIQAYQSSHQDVKISYKKFENVTEYEQVVLNELAEGRGPAIFAIRNDWINDYLGKIQPAPASIIVPEKFRETFLAVASDDLVRNDMEGVERVWGIPLFVDTLALYYNKQLFRDNLPSSTKPAETWNDLKEQVYGLTKADNSIERFSVSGIAMGLATNISAFSDILSLLFLQEGTTLYDAAEERAVFAKSQGVSAGTGTAFFPALEALKLYVSFALPSSRHVSWNLPITGLYPSQKEIGAFARGKTAMIFGFSSLYDDIKIAIDGLARANERTIKLEDVDTAAVPQFSESLANGKRDAFAKYYPLVVSRNTPYGAEAWDLLNFLATPESLAAYHEKTHKPTSRLDMVEKQVPEKIFGVFAAQAPYAKSFQTLDSEAFFTIFGRVVDDIAKGLLSPEQGLQQAEKQMSCILKKKKQPELSEDCFAV